MDLFDLVRAASPPPTPTARKDGSDAKAEVESKVKRETLSPSSSPMRLSSMFNLEDSDTDTIPRSPLIEDIKTPPPLMISLDEGTQEEGGSYKNTSKLKKSAKYKDEDDTESNSDSDGDDDQDANQLQPLKTKAEQKMFTDAKAVAAKKQKMAKAGKRCIVRIKRLKQSEIDHFTQGKAIKHKKNRKRQPSISHGSSWDDTPLPTKRPRSSVKVHVKVPLVQNGSKQRSSLNVSRAHTPPPSLKKPSKKVKPFTASKTLIKQYGSRFFNCYVKMNRLKDPDVGSSKRIKLKSKSKLSVSFSEAVEILGSKPRKSSSISGTSRETAKLNSSVPTRLQRVDATGNVLEDIELKPDTVLKSSTSSGGHKKRGRQAACNGGKRTASMLKRPAVRVPVTDLASLRINDSHDEEEAAAPANDPGEEYIVPNDMPVYRAPNLNRSGTTTPKEIPKRVAEVTTTISDDEDADGSLTECKMKKTAAYAKRAKAEDKKEATTETEDDEQKEAEEADSEPEPVHPEPEKRELKAEDPELDDDSTSSSPVLTVLTDEVTTDDILEIQTSIEDVRELHTPPSRRTSPLMTPPSIIDENRSQRHDSPESDSSFKSADDRESSVAAVQSSLQSLTGRQVSASDSFVDEPPKPPVITASMLGGSQQSASGAGAMPQPLYSSMVDMPTLDDEIDQIIEPDFQMANSLHSNSRLTMEDILTVFEA